MGNGIVEAFFFRSLFAGAMMWGDEEERKEI